MHQIWYNKVNKYVIKFQIFVTFTNYLRRTKLDDKIQILISFKKKT